MWTIRQSPSAHRERTSFLTHLRNARASMISPKFTTGIIFLFFTLFLPIRAQSCEDKSKDANKVTVCKLSISIDVYGNCSFGVIEKYELSGSPDKSFERIVPSYFNDVCLKKGDSEPDCKNNTNTVSFDTAGNDSFDVTYRTDDGTYKVHDYSHLYYRRRLAYILLDVATGTVNYIEDLDVTVTSRGLAEVSFPREDDSDVGEVKTELDNPESKKKLMLKDVTSPKEVHVQLLNYKGACGGFTPDTDSRSPIWAIVTIIAVSLLAPVVWLLCAFRKSSAPPPPVERVPLTAQNLRRPLPPPLVPPRDIDPEQQPGFRQRSSAPEQHHATPELV